MKNIINNDTIAAISTPLGEGGIGIVRLSGGKSFVIADTIFSPLKGKKPSFCASHTMHYGYIKEPGRGEIIDEVLLTVMRAPSTYTAEDIVEINCHGGIELLKKVLGLCLKQGARLAQPGEFTRRAFLNGKIDLTQAEAVIDVIKAKTEMSYRVAIRQLEGTFSKEINMLCGKIVDVLALIELAIDFSEEDVEFSSEKKIISDLKNVYRSIEKLLNTYKKGRFLREGANVVICGRPNVGKSSLMNALVGHERVIVTSIAGTTRDVVDEEVNIGGVEVRLFDTAGIVETKNKVEFEGVKRSKEQLSSADVVIFVVDSSRPFTSVDQKIYDMIKDQRVIIALNKSDLRCKLDVDKLKQIFNKEPVLKISALKKQGLKTLEKRITEKLFDGQTGLSEGVVVTNLRHKDILEKSLQSLHQALDTLDNGFNEELIAIDLNEAIDYLRLFNGKTIDVSVLDRIFSQFCIGK